MGLDALTWIRRARVKPYIRGLGDRALMDSFVVTMMHSLRSYFSFGHINGLIGCDPAVHARPPKIQRDESRTQGRDYADTKARISVLDLGRQRQQASHHAAHRPRSGRP